MKVINGSLMIIVLYVDDLLITEISKDEIASLKGAMNQAFSMTDLGLPNSWGLRLLKPNLE